MKYRACLLFSIGLALFSAQSFANQFIYNLPTNGTPAPVQIGTFDRVSPTTTYFPVAQYLNSSTSNLGNLLEGDTITKVFSVKVTSPKTVSNITASVSSAMGDAYVTTRVSCTPPATLNSASPDEICDVILTLNASSAGEQSFVVNLSGKGSSYENVLGSFVFTANVTSEEEVPEEPVGGAISFVPTAEDPIQGMYALKIESPIKEVLVLNSGNTVLNEVLLPQLTSIVDGEFSLYDTTCGYPSGEYEDYNPDTDSYFTVQYPAEPITLNPGETCAIYVRYSPPEDVVGYSSQGSLTVTSTVGHISASLTGETIPLTPSQLAGKFASTFEESEIPGFREDLSQRYEFASEYLTQTGAFAVNITGTESVTINSVQLTPIKGWMSTDNLISNLASNCEVGAILTHSEPGCRVYLLFQALDADNGYSFRLDMTGTTQSGQPVTYSRTISGAVPHALGVKLYIQGYSLNGSAFNSSNAEDFLHNCGTSRWCGVYQVSVGNATQENIIVNSISYSLPSEHFDFDIDGDTMDRGCVSSNVHASWQLSDPETLPGYYSIVNDWEFSVSCTDTFMVTQDRDYISGGFPDYNGLGSTSAPDGSVKVDVAVNYTIADTGATGVYHSYTYVPLILIGLISNQ